MMLGWIASGANEGGTFNQAFDRIQLEKGHGRAAFGGQAHDVFVHECEVL